MPIAQTNRLGMSRQALRNCEEEGAGLYIALACTALLKALPPYLGKKS
jgi:hypothetical protein